MKRASMLEDDKTNLDKIQHSFKIMFFEIVHNLILGDNFPFFIYVFFILIESLQIFYFFFTDDVLIINNLVFFPLESTIMDFSPKLIF